MSSPILNNSLTDLDDQRHVEDAPGNGRGDRMLDTYLSYLSQMMAVRAEILPLSIINPQQGISNYSQLRNTINNLNGDLQHLMS